MKGSVFFLSPDENSPSTYNIKLKLSLYVNFLSYQFKRNKNHT
jgi:hypothetical protein